MPPKSNIVKMKIIIAGGGEVGFHLAKLLSYESQDITLIDPDKRSLQYADNNLDIKTVRGSGTSLITLKEAEVHKADLIIAVTSSETANITICAFAKQLGCKHSIARISNHEYIKDKKEIRFDQLGVDELISPDQLATNEIEHLVNQSAFNDAYKFEQGLLSLVGILLPSTAPLVGKTLAEVAQSFPELNFMAIAIQRRNEEKTIIPRGNTLFERGDQIYFITNSSGEEKLYELAGKQRERLKRIMILGGSVVGIKVATRLSQNGYDVKLFEINKEKAYELADKLPNVLIINGDGRDGVLLEEENIRATDVFVAVTNDDETNMMACMMAKKKQAKKTIAISDNMDYYPLMRAAGIDSLINKKILAANSIFKHIRKGNVASTMRLSNTNAEILEFIIKSDSEVVGKQIRDIEFPRTAIIGGVVRKGVGYIPLGRFVIETDDHIIVCCLPEAIRKLEKLFV